MPLSPMYPPRAEPTVPDPVRTERQSKVFLAIAYGLLGTFHLATNRRPGLGIGWLVMAAAWGLRACPPVSRWSQRRQVLVGLGLLAVAGATSWLFRLF